MIHQIHSENDAFPFSYVNESGTFKAYTVKETLFPFGKSQAQSISRRHNGRIEVKQHNTNKDGNIDNEIVYARFIAKRDGINVSSCSYYEVNYGFVKLEAYVNDVKQARSVEFYNKDSNGKKIDSIVIKIPHFGYDCTKPPIDLSNVTESNVVTSVPKKRGRPLGSKNKNKAIYFINVSHIEENGIRYYVYG